MYKLHFFPVLLWYVAASYAAQAEVISAPALAHAQANPAQMIIHPACTATTHHLQKTLYGPLRAESARFIDNVLRQIPSKEFFKVIDATRPQGTDQEIYQQIQPAVNAIKPRLLPYYQLKALSYQKGVLSGQVKQLIGDKKAIDGYLEIGTPGTYTKSIQQFLPMTGTIYAMNDQEKFTDRIQCNGILPYHKFVQLNDYAPIAESSIPSNSVDMIVCFIGLHHVPQEKLQNFVASIHRILRPGGVFILRDHDVVNDNILSIAHAAHSIFNVIVANETPESEAQEYRNFQPLSFWISLLEKQGFKTGTERLLQEGDPTANTLLKFTKLACTPEQQLQDITHNKLKHDTNYQRDGIHTFLTGPEWLNVDAAQDYAAFVPKKPWYEFPHLKYVASYWNLFAKASLKAAREKGWLPMLKSEATTTNLFIGTTMTAEYAAKSLGYIPNKLMCWKTPVTKLQQFDNHVSQEYGDFLNHTPWYEFPYFKKLGEYWAEFKESGVNRKNVCLGFNRLIEFTAKGIVAKPVAWMCKGTAPLALQALIHDPKNDADNVDKRIKVIKQYDNSAYKVVEIPRYKEFLELVPKIARNNITIIEIAGNKEIQFKVRYKKDNPAHAVMCSTIMKGCTHDYAWHLPTQPEYVYGCLTVQTTELRDVLQFLHNNAIEIVYIHDF